MEGVGTAPAAEVGVLRAEEVVDVGAVLGVGAEGSVGAGDGAGDMVVLEPRLEASSLLEGAGRLRGTSDEGIVGALMRVASRTRETVMEEDSFSRMKTPRASSKMRTHSCC